MEPRAIGGRSNRSRAKNDKGGQTSGLTDRRTSLEGAEQRTNEAGSRILINGIDPSSFAYVNRGASPPPR